MLHSSGNKRLKLQGRRRPITRKRARRKKKQQGSTEADTRVVVPSIEPKGLDKGEKEKGTRKKEQFVWDKTIKNQTLSNN